jgi:hypothetical protein
MEAENLTCLLAYQTSNISGVNFINVLPRYEQLLQTQIPKVQQGQSSCQSFLLLGSVREKAARRKLMPLTPGENIYPPFRKNPIPKFGLKSCLMDIYEWLIFSTYGLESNFCPLFLFKKNDFDDLEKSALYLKIKACLEHTF